MRMPEIMLANRLPEHIQRIGGEQIARRYLENGPAGELGEVAALHVAELDLAAGMATTDPDTPDDFERDAGERPRIVEAKAPIGQELVFRFGPRKRALLAQGLKLAPRDGF